MFEMAGALETVAAILNFASLKLKASNKGCRVVILTAEKTYTIPVCI